MTTSNNCTTAGTQLQTPGGAYASVPEELRERPQWVCYKLGRRPRRNRPDELVKTPYDAHTGAKASTTNAETWASFAQAAAMVSAHKGYGGIGYVFAEGDPYLGVDLDKCRDPETGEIAAWARTLLDILKSYAEVSPSGTGVHVFVRAPGLAHGLARKYEGGKVELYTSERFFTVTGQHVADTPLTIEERGAEVERVRALVWGAEAEGSVPSDADGHYPAATCGVTGLTDEDVLRRCRSDKDGERFAAVYDDGDLSDFDYDDSRADWYVWGKLVFYIGDDVACVARLGQQGAHYRRPDDPGEAAEREKKWQRPHVVYGTFQQWEIATLLAGRGPERVFGGAARTSTRQTASEKAKASPAPLADVAYYGVLGDIARGIEPYIEADSAALLVNLLVASGIALGREPYLQTGAGQQHAVLRSVTVGETSENKSDSSTPVRAILASVPPPTYEREGHVVEFTPPSPPVGGGLSTGEGLLWQVRDERHEQRPNKKTHTVDDVVVDPGVEDKRLLALEPEFARVLAVMSRDSNTLSTVLRDLFDSPAEAKVTTKNNPVVATAPHVGLLAQITPAELERKMRDTEQYNGFAGRFLWVLTHRIKSLPAPPDYTGKVREHARWWGDAIRNARNLSAMRQDHRAVQQWAEEYELLRVGGRAGVPPRKGMAKDVCSRAHVQVLRMALIFAAMDGASVITVAHQTAALAVWDYCEHCAAYLFGDLAADPIENVVANALRRQQRMRREELLALFSRHQPTDAIQRALDALATDGKVRCTKEPTAGRPIEWWEWAAA